LEGAKEDEEGFRSLRKTVKRFVEALQWREKVNSQEKMQRQEKMEK
jgi:hypothetical protein